MGEREGEAEHMRPLTLNMSRGLTAPFDPRRIEEMFLPRLVIGLTLALPLAVEGGYADAKNDPAAREVERALDLKADPDRGREVYLLCAVCHQPEGWGMQNGEYPQVAGQHASVVIKELADIRARNRDTPIMLPFTMLEHLTLQDMADVAAYIQKMPMTPTNGMGPGTDLALGEKLYWENCADCHGHQGEGIPRKHMPLIQGQHYAYLVRQFEWIRDGKRRNADEEMVKQIQGFTSRDIHAVMDYVSRLNPPAERMAPVDWKSPDFPKFVREKSLLTEELEP